MTRLAANLTMLFNEYEPLDRFDRAAANGFGGVEMLFPYPHTIDEIKARLDANNLDMVLINLPAGDWAAGERGVASHPDRVDEFREGVALAAEYAAALGVPRINCLVGKSPDPEGTHQTLVDNIAFAADALAKVNTRLLVEPVNAHDIPGFIVTTTAEGLALIDEVNHPNLGLQFDVYHSLRMGEDPLAIITERGSSIEHIQIADVPGRHQPGSGEYDFRQLFETIDQSGYDGWVSLEYVPEGPTESGFDLLRELGVLGAAS